MKVEIVFACIPVSDLERSVAWYSQLSDRPPDIVVNPDEVMWKMNEEAWMYLVVDPDRAGGTSVTISVGDLQRVVAELAGRGVTAGTVQPVGESGHKSTLVDPDGNAVSLIEVNGGRA